MAFKKYLSCLNSFSAAQFTVSPLLDHFTKLLISLAAFPFFSFCELSGKIYIYILEHIQIQKQSLFLHNYIKWVYVTQPDVLNVSFRRFLSQTEAPWKAYWEESRSVWPTYEPRISSLLFTRFEMEPYQCVNLTLTTRQTSKWNSYLEPVGPIIASLQGRQNVSVKYLHRLEQLPGAYRDSVHRTSARLRKHVGVYSLISLKRFESPIRCPLTVRALISKMTKKVFILFAPRDFSNLQSNHTHIVIYGFA